MLNLINSLSLMRYLIVLRVNSPMARVGPHLAADLSQILGSIIADRLPSREAKSWHKAAEYWSMYPELSVNPEAPRGRPDPRDRTVLRSIPAAPWPLESVLFPYPGKRSYGQGEPILLELKLFGDSADHGIFLELILPALEHASTTVVDGRGNKYPLWGHFDIDRIYVARGLDWEPMTQAGRLNLDYRPTPAQWADGLNFEPPQRNRQRVLLWLTPFEFAARGNADPRSAPPIAGQGQPMPSLLDVLDALFQRLARILPGKRTDASDIPALLAGEDQRPLLDELARMRQRAPRAGALEQVPKEWPEGWLGMQRHDAIAAAIVPCLRLASILHIGRHTHLGYGTFALR